MVYRVQTQPAIGSALSLRTQLHFTSLHFAATATGSLRISIKIYGKLKVKGRKAGFIQHCNFKKLIVLLPLT
jgi:hypothetical protein